MIFHYTHVCAYGTENSNFTDKVRDKVNIEGCFRIGLHQTRKLAYREEEFLGEHDRFNSQVYFRILIANRKFLHVTDSCSTTYTIPLHTDGLLGEIKNTRLDPNKSDAS